MGNGSDAKVVFDTELDESGLKRGLSRLGTSVGVMAKGIGLAIGAVATGLGALAKNAMQYNSQMEQYQISFETMLGSASAAQAKVAELKEFAAKTPFEMTDLADATKTLLQFGVAEGKTSEKMKQLGDISQGNKEKFSQLSLVYGQMSSTGKLMGQDLLQMINSGFNPLQQIAQKTGATMGDLKAIMGGEKTSKEFKSMVKSAQAEVKKLGDGASDGAKMLAQIGTEGMISADMVDQAMQLATSSGGLFYGAMDKQSKTAAGMISTLTDNVKALGGEAFAGLSEEAKTEAIPAAIGYVDQLTTALREGGTKGLVSAFGDVLGSVVSQGSSYAPQVINMAVGLIKSLATGLKKNAKTIAKGFAEAFKAAASGIIQAAPTIIAAALSIAMELASSLADEFPALLPELVDAIFQTLAILLANAPKLIAIGIKVASALVLGIIRGIGALFTGIGDLFTSIFSGTKVNAQEVQDYVDRKTSGYVKAYADTKTKIDELKASINGGLEQNDTDLDKAMALVNALSAMGNPKDLSGSELEQYKAIVAQLKTDWPELAPYIGKNGLFKQDTEAIKEHIQQLIKEKQIEALLNKLPDAIDVNDQAKQGWLDRRQAILDEIALLKQKQSEQTAAIALQDKINEIANSTTMSDSDTISATKKALDDYIAAGGSLDSVKQNLSDVSSLDFSNVSDALDVLTALDTLSIDPDGKLATDIASIQALIDALYNGGTTADGTQIPAFSDLQSQVDDSKTVLDELQAKIDALYASDQTETAPASRTKSMKKSVDTDIANTGTALDDGKTTLSEKAALVRDEVIAALSGEGTTAASDAGAGIVDGVGDGMKVNDRIKTTLATKVTDATNSAKTSGNLKGYSIGSNIVAGVVQGINDHGYKINLALTAAISVALLAVMRLLGIKSPSTVMRDLVGKNMALGVGVGFTTGMTDVTKSIANSISLATKAGQAALGDTLLARVQSATGIGTSYPTTSAVSASVLKGSGLSSLYGGTSVGGAVTTVDARQYVTFANPIQAPDEVARAMRRVGSYGLAGART